MPASTPRSLDLSAPSDTGHSERRRLLLRSLAAGLPLLSGVLSGCGGASAAETATPTTETPEQSVAITTDPYTVAVVAAQASSSFNLTEAIDTMITLMAQAKQAGARLVAFGELWLPGYPVQLNFQADWKAQEWAKYLGNSITVGDAHWQRILVAAQSLSLYVCFGFSELEGNHAFMSQALVSDAGQLLYKRRKVRPSGGERAYWSDAPMAGNLEVVTTPLGRISMLQCWDHVRPQSTFNIMAQLPNVHICAWPYIGETTASTQFWEREEIATTAAAYFSQLTGAYTVMPSVGFAGVYRNSVQLSGQRGSAGAILYQTITPAHWTGATGSDTSEFSYGVLQLLVDDYPGNQVADPDHGVLNLVPISG